MHYCVVCSDSFFLLAVATRVSACIDTNNAYCSRHTTAASSNLLIYAAAHCHAPACQSIELWNDGTGGLICRNEPVYGNSTTQVQNKAAYIVGIPPCLWGAAKDGLSPPPVLDLDANLPTVKRANNTNGRWGVMALWQMRAAYLDWSLN